jgi:hypothetical protein
MTVYDTYRPGRKPAAALQTTPAALLGARAQIPPGHGDRVGQPVIEGM